MKISLLAWEADRGSLNRIRRICISRSVFGFASHKVSNMKRGIRFLSRAGMIALLLSAGMIPPAPPARTPTTPLITVANRYEVRLRKLHLVRPDLILYPIQYEVYC